MDQGFYFYLVSNKQDGDLVVGWSLFLISSMSICFYVGLYGLSTYVSGVVVSLCFYGCLLVQVKQWNNIGVLRYGYWSGYAWVMNYYWDFILMITSGNYGSTEMYTTLRYHCFVWKFWTGWGLKVKWHIGWEILLLEMEKEMGERLLRLGLTCLYGTYSLYLEINGTEICCDLLDYSYTKYGSNCNFVWPDILSDTYFKILKVVSGWSIYRLRCSLWKIYLIQLNGVLNDLVVHDHEGLLWSVWIRIMGFLVFTRYYDRFESVSPSLIKYII